MVAMSSAPQTELLKNAVGVIQNAKVKMQTRKMFADILAPTADPDASTDCISEMFARVASWYHAGFNGDDCYSRETDYDGIDTACMAGRCVRRNRRAGRPPVFFAHQ
jgi:hypothetical protein